jgi:hypothetical protein
MADTINVLLGVILLNVMATATLPILNLLFSSVEVPNPNSASQNTAALFELLSTESTSTGEPANPINTAIAAAGVAAVAAVGISAIVIPPNVPSLPQGQVIVLI